MTAIQQLLDDGQAQLAIPVSTAAATKLQAFIALLEKWNQAYNLTAVREPTQMVSRHVLDSLAVLPHVQGSRVLDIGTGPGLPGIPLALAKPEWHFTLLDANAKKTRFVTQAVAELRLENVEVVQARVEKFAPTHHWDTVVTRAFGSLAEIIAAAGHLVAPHGRVVAMKGVYPEEELGALPAGFQLKAVEALKVPQLEAARHVVIVAPTKAA